MDLTALKEAALSYAELGLAVFPLVPKKKIPATKNGVNDATTDLAQINEWWSNNPNANIGIAMGTASGGIFAVDIDVDDEKGKDGFSSIREFEKENGSLPETAMTKTGRGGTHMLYHSDSIVGNKVGVLEGVDIRGEGGYIVAPPSVHPNGSHYSWEYDLEDYQIAEINESLTKLLQSGKNLDGTAKKKFELPAIIPKGERNDTLFRYAASLQARGIPNYELEVLVMNAAQTRCQPELSKSEVEEVRKTIFSAESYEKGIVLDRDDNGKIKQTIKNATKVLENDSELTNIFFNEVSYSIYINGAVQWEHKNVCREWDNHDKSYLLSYMESKYGLRNEKAITVALDTVSFKRKYNPITDLLESLPQWDGEDRISTFLSKYLGADDAELTGELFKLWLLGAIKRAYEPGVKFDYMLVLVGGQGIGKSYFLSQLAMNALWYDDNFTMLEGKESVARLRGKWIVEWDELNSSGRKKDLETIKSFITSTYDNYRPPYKEVTEQRARRCVFAGTTNDRSFLSDPTGNRRFLPIYSTLLKSKDELFAKKSFRNEINQLWAQALHIYKTENPELVLSRETEARLQGYRDRFIQEDPRIGQIRKFFDESKKKRICSLDVWQDGLGEMRQMLPHESKAILNIMRDVCEDYGWESIGKASCSTARNVQCFEKIGSGYEKLEENEVDF